VCSSDLEAITQARKGLDVNPEWRHRKKDGSIIEVEIARHNLLFGGRPAAMILTTDLTERKRGEAALRESNERLRLALAAGKMGTWTIDLNQNNRVFSSPELESIFGLKPGDWDGRLKNVLKMIHPGDRPAVRKAIQKTIASGGDYEVEFRFIPRERPMGWLLVRGRAYYDDSGQAKRLAGVGIDITAQKQAELEVVRLNTELERRVHSRTVQLEAANKELEAFSYSVSHDLRAPLRSIRGFSEVLLQRYADKLDNRGREFLRRACESCQHMDMLIEDLLKLSRVGRSELQRRWVDLSALSGKIAAELRQSEPKRSVNFIIAPDLKAQGDERLLRIVLENLLSNAWKFTSHKTKARIEVGFAEAPEPAFFVRDNGAGFDMAYAGRLFGVFQRLHSVSEFPGTGVGLATVQRILNRHGGHAWADGEVENGATFYFTLPSNGNL